MILIVANHGHTDEIMNTARAAGARGGTILRSRWAGPEDTEKFYGMKFQAEKEIVVIMTTAEYTPRALAFCDGRLIADRSAAAILCDPALIEQAALKETSLYTLANRCGITPAEKFVERFIAADREVRADGC